MEKIAQKLLDGLITNLKDTLIKLQKIHKKGGGLAAPQIGYLKRICFVSAKGRSFYMINPRIIQKSKKNTILILENHILTAEEEFDFIERIMLTIENDPIGYRGIQYLKYETELEKKGLFSRGSKNAFSIIVPSDAIIIQDETGEISVHVDQPLRITV